MKLRRPLAALASAALVLSLLPCALADEADTPTLISSNNEDEIVIPSEEDRHAGVASGTSWCTLRFNTNGGTPVEAVYTHYDTFFRLTDYTTTREDYTFTGWYLDKDLLSPAETLVLRNDTTVYAGWQADFEPEPEPIVDPGNPFTDVALDAYYHDSVVWAVANSVTGGTTDTTFSPDWTCTRAQFVTFLWRAAGSPEPDRSAPTFADVPSGAYYEKAARWAAEKGITTGTASGLFDPSGTLNRAQAVTFLWRYAGKPASGAATRFTDVSYGSYYFDAMLWAIEMRVTGGTSDTTFSPYSACTRAQTVTFLYRHFN